MGNLVPEKRRDRNGRLVTRHVRVDVAGSSKGTIPAPTAKRRPTTVKEYSKAISDHLLEAAGDEDREILLGVCQRYGIKPLKMVYDRLDEVSERDAEIIDGAIMSIFKSAMKQGKSKLAQDRHLAAFMEAYPAVSRFSGNTLPGYISSVASDITYAAQFNKIPVESNGATNEEDRAILQWFAFESIVMRVNTSRTREWLVEESKWFTENMDALHPYADLIRQRGTVNQEFLQELLQEDTSPVLTEGTL